MHPGEVIAIVPPSLLQTEERLPRPAGRPLTWSVRAVLVVAIAGLVAVFAIALWLDPYDEEGQPRLSETHCQLGLPPCTFKVMTRQPCPSCGMTSSFALLAHGDVNNSLRANAVGTLLAVFSAALLAWGVASLSRNRLLLVAAPERALTWAVGFFLTLLLARWAIVVGPAFVSR